VIRPPEFSENRFPLFGIMLIEGMTMSRSRDIGPGFTKDPAPVASSGLIHAVAASLAIALSVCLVVALTLASARLALALPLPG